ncbi:hypothetical protein BTVI_118567 [Pitangus sulphuratus]|nr:hypothetical protein BTVI_118567 [Pitangus sulphuratus]
MIKGLAHFSCEDGLKDLELFSLEKRRFQEDLTAAFQYQKGAYKRDGEGLLITDVGDGPTEAYREWRKMQKGCKEVSEEEVYLEVL